MGNRHGTVVDGAPYTPIRSVHQSLFTELGIIFEYLATDRAVCLHSDVLNNSCANCTTKQIRDCIHSLGRNLVSSMSRESSKDTLDTIKEIHKLLDSIELKQVFTADDIFKFYSSLI